MGKRSEKVWLREKTNNLKIFRMMKNLNNNKSNYINNSTNNRCRGKIIGESSNNLWDR